MFDCRQRTERTEPSISAICGRLAKQKSDLSVQLHELVQDAAREEPFVQKALEILNVCEEEFKRAVDGVTKLPEGELYDPERQHRNYTGYKYMENYTVYSQAYKYLLSTKCEGENLDLLRSKFLESSFSNDSFRRQALLLPQKPLKNSEKNWLKVVIFDKDGTLVQFHEAYGPWIEYRVNEITRRLNLEEHQVRKIYQFLAYDISGHRVLGEHSFVAWAPNGLIRDVLATFLNQVLLDVCSKDAVYQTVREVFADDTIGLGPIKLINKDIRSLFTALHDNGIKVVVMTSDGRESTEKQLKEHDLSDVVDFLVCGDDKNCRKPHPFGLIRACKNFGFTPANAVMIGDTRADMLTGRAAGVRQLIGVLSGCGTANDLCTDWPQELGSDYLVQEVGPNLLKQMEEFSQINNDADHKSPSPLDEVDASLCRTVDMPILREIGLMIRIVQIGEIDVLRHSFFAELLVEVDWIPTVDEVTTYLGSKTSVSPSPTESKFNPTDMIYFTNAIDVNFSSPWSSVKLIYNENFGKYLMKKSATLTGTFREKYELENFPLDIQELKIVLYIGTSTKDKESVIFVPSRNRPMCCKLELETCALEDYTVENLNLCFHLSDIRESTVGQSYSMVYAIVKVSRRWKPYIWRIYVMITLVSFSSLAVFVDDLEYGEQLSYTATMLLTAVAFQFVTSSSLPVIPNLTFLDFGVLANIVYIFAVGITISLVDAPNTVLTYALTLWVAVIVYMMFDGYRRRSAELKKINMAFGREVAENIQVPSKDGAMFSNGHQNSFLFQSQL